MNNSIGIYIHIPYCRSKCPYCDFFSLRGNNDDYKSYVSVLKKSIEYWGEKCGKKADSIYFGGGTPSILGAELICEILDSVYKSFNIDNNAEITIEANPASGKFFDFHAVKSFGVNRVSLGLQSSDEKELKALGRIHSLSDAFNSIELIKSSGIDNISLDLMLGVPSQNMNSLKKSLDFCIDSGVNHISSYILKIEENTFYGKNRDKFSFPDDELTSDLYLFTVEYLDKNGFKQYEISNFAVPGYESRHNLKYWNLDDYIGIGPGAHSFLNGRRFYYERDMKSFKDNIIKDEGVGGNKEEFIMLQLRLKKGLDINKYKEAFGEELPKDFYIKAEKYIKSGFLNKSGNRLFFTAKGFLVSNSIITELLP